MILLIQHELTDDQMRAFFEKVGIGVWCETPEALHHLSSKPDEVLWVSIRDIPVQINWGPMKSVFHRKTLVVVDGDERISPKGKNLAEGIMRVTCNSVKILRGDDVWDRVIKSE